MGIKLNSEKQQQGIVTVLTVNTTVNDLLQKAAQKIGGLDYSGGAKDALLENFRTFEKAVNGNVDDFAKIEKVCKDNIEMTDEMTKALHQQGRVSNKTASVDIKGKKADIKGIAGKF